MINPYRLVSENVHVSSRGFFELVTVVGAFLLAEPSSTSLMVGASVSLLGEAIRIWASGYVRRTDIFYVAGPYRFVRHPRYLGTFLLLLGICIAARNFYVVSWLLLGVTFIYWRSLRSEEEKLLRIAGPEFSLYRSEVPAFIPQIIPVERLIPKIQGVSKSAFSLDEKDFRFSFNYSIFQRKRRELDSIVGMVLCFGLLYICMIIPSKVIFNVVFVGVLLLALATRVLYYRVKHPHSTVESR